MSLANNIYTNGTATVTWAGINGATVTKNASDCTTFITNLLKTSYGFTSSQFTGWFGASSPNLDTYYSRAVSNSTFEAYTKLSDIKPGDLFIADYIDNVVARGHMGIIESAPVRKGLLNDGSGLTRWDVAIIDCTGAPHSSLDTRANVADPTEPDGEASGVGRGYMSYFTDASGNIYTWSWSAINNAYRYDPATSPIRMVRVMPTVNNSTFTFGEENQTVTIDFQRPMNLATFAATDLQVTNLTTNQTYAAESWTATADGSAITFTLPLNLPNGNYRMRMNSGAVSTQAGNALSLTHNLTGNNVYLMAGDIDRDRDVDFDDLLVLAKNYGQSDKGYSQGDVNYDASGNVDFDDLLVIARSYGSTLGTSAAISAADADYATTLDATDSDTTSTRRTRVAVSVL